MSIESMDVEQVELVSKCGGLPKLIVAIADVLASGTRTRTDTVSLNQRFMHHLETKPEYDDLRGLFDWMHSFFRICPDLLKPCIFYLSIFPREKNIRRRRLVRRWIAEGYSRDNHEDSAENNGERQFSDLLNPSIIQQPPQTIATSTLGDTKMALCQVNSFMHEYIVSRQTEENFVFVLGNNSALTTKRRGRHLVIPYNFDRKKTVFESIDFSRLRSLTVYGIWISFFISDGMKLLRVLDLEDAEGVRDDDLDKMVRLLPRLKFLSLRGCCQICNLPSSLGDLRQLETLDIRYTSITTLPKSVIELQKLQYIRAGLAVNVSSNDVRFGKGQCRQDGVKLPGGIGKLTALHTVGVINVAASGGMTILKELKQLTQLRKLGVSGINSHNSEMFEASDYFAHLESLYVKLDENNGGCLENMCMPWVNLQSLKMHGLGHSVHPSMEGLTKLRKLELGMDDLGNVELLARLPELCILRLDVKQTSLHFLAQQDGSEVKSFQKVKILEIACSSNRIHVTFGSKSMKSLELLKLVYSSGSSYQFSGLVHLSELKQVFYCSDDYENTDALQANLKSQLADHPKQPVVKQVG